MEASLPAMNQLRANSASAPARPAALYGAASPVRGRSPGRPGFPVSSEADRGVGSRTRGSAQ